MAAQTDESVDAQLRAVTPLLARASRSGMGARGLGDLLLQALEACGRRAAVVLRTDSGARVLCGAAAGSELAPEPGTWWAAAGLGAGDTLELSEGRTSLVLMVEGAPKLDAALAPLMVVERAARLELAAAQTAEVLELRRRVDRLTEGSLLIRGFAHEFRNILNVLIAALEMPPEYNQRGEPVPADLRIEELVGSMAEARSSTSRSQFLVDRVSYIVKAEHTDLFEIDVGEAIYDAEHSLDRAAGRECKLDLQIGEGLPQVLAEPSYLSHMLAELVENAQAASAPGETIEVRLARLDVPADGSNLHPRLMPGAWVHLSVKDQGDGMSPNVAEKAFSGFYGNSRGRARLGLGLTEVALVTSRFQGQVRLDSVAFVGTTLHVYLPSAELAAAGELQCLQIALHAKVLPAIVVLLNNSGDQVLVEALLRSAGFPVSSYPPPTGHTAEALDQLIRSNPGVAIFDDPASLQPGGVVATASVAVPALRTVFFGWALPGADGHLTAKVNQHSIARELRRVLELPPKPAV